MIAQAVQERYLTDPLFHGRVHLVQRHLIQQGHAIEDETIATVLYAHDQLQANSEALNAPLFGDPALHTALARLAAQTETGLRHILATGLGTGRNLPPEDRPQ